ncbi:hypothetical protein ACIQ7D_23250 [Streptomyces sp. NPDC096310]|uniref:hypothetical protein n=1 Tax=Streptomyces sp. NPDC096310 TaxID=3366082 RepID=UPI00382A4BCA
MAEGDEKTRPSMPSASSDVPQPSHPLLARFHEHLERHAPEDLLVLSRDELGERETKAYADGWRDAMAAYESARERADADPGPPRLRLVHRGAAEPAPSPAPDETATTTETESATTPPAPDAAAAPDPVASPPPRAGVSRPATAGLVPKNPSSRVPTIPRLGSPRNLGKRIPGGSAGEPARSREQSRERDPEGRSPARPDG